MELRLSLWPSSCSLLKQVEGIGTGEGVVSEIDPDNERGMPASWINDGPQQQAVAALDRDSAMPMYSLL